MRQPIFWAVTVLLALHALGSSAYLLRFPAWRAPDEGAHFAYILYLFRTGALPVFQGMGKGTTYEAHQPPLYYLTALPIAAPWLRSESKHITAMFVLRVVSALWGALIVLCAFGLTLRLQSGLPTALPAALLSGGFATLLPMHLLVCASVGNDATAGATSSATLLWLCFFCTYHPSPVANRQSLRWGLATGVFCGAALLAKSSNLILLPLALLALLTTQKKVVAESRSKRKPHKKPMASHRLLPTAFCLLTFILTAGWWLVRNRVLYGDPLAMKAFLEGFATSPKPSYFLDKLGLSIPTYLVMVAQVTLFTWLGIFGEPNEAVKGLGRLAQGEEPTAGWVMVCSFIGIALLTALALGGLETCRRSWQALRGGEGRIALAHALPLLLLLLVFLEFVQFNRHFFQAQARYFYPAHAAMAHLFALGLLRFVPEKKAWWAVGIGFASLAVLAAIVWWQWASLPS